MANESESSKDLHSLIRENEIGFSKTFKGPFGLRPGFYLYLYFYLILFMCKNEFYYDL